MNPIKKLLIVKRINKLEQGEDFYKLPRGSRVLTKGQTDIYTKIKKKPSKC